MKNNELQHFGVLGMRWGRRSGGSGTPGATTRQGKLVAKTKSFRGKQIPVTRRGRPIKDMSVDEANKIVMDKFNARKEAKKRFQETLSKSVSSLPLVVGATIIGAYTYTKLSQLRVNY